MLDGFGEGELGRVCWADMKGGMKGVALGGREMDEGVPRIRLPPRPTHMHRARLALKHQLNLLRRRRLHKLCARSTRSPRRWHPQLVACTRLEQVGLEDGSEAPRAGGVEGARE